MSLFILESCCFIVSITEYDQLKKAVLDHLQANKHQLIEQALSAFELGDKRPSQLVSDIKKRFQEIGLKADDTIVKSRLLTALPPHLRSALVGHEDVTIEQYAKIADSMLAMATPLSPFSSTSINHFHKSPSRPERAEQSFSVRMFYEYQRLKYVTLTFSMAKEREPAGTGVDRQLASHASSTEMIKTPINHAVTVQQTHSCLLYTSPSPRD